MSTKRSVILRGDPIYNEEGVATATVKPGYLVKGVSLIAHQTVDSAVKIPAAFACERDELGQGIDNSLQGSGTASAFYASGDTVKVAVCGPGDQVTAFITSGENITEDDLLASAGDGTLEEADTAFTVSGVAFPDYAVARALETLGAVTGNPQVCRIEIL